MRAEVRSHTTHYTMSGSEDLQVVVQEVPSDPVKPAPQPAGKLAGAAAAGKQFLSTPKGKAAAGLGLLCLLVPAIVAPAVIASNKQAGKHSGSLDNSSSRDINSQTGSDVNPSAFVGVDGEASATNTTQLKIPTRTLNQTKTEETKKNLTVVREKWTPYVKIQNGQVRRVAV